MYHSWICWIQTAAFLSSPEQLQSYNKPSLVLICLDLLAAFNMFNHKTLLFTPTRFVIIGKSVQVVCLLSDAQRGHLHLTICVPLGSLIFSLYTKSVSRVTMYTDILMTLNDYAAKYPWKISSYHLIMHQILWTTNCDSLLILVTWHSPVGLFIFAKSGLFSPRRHLKCFFSPLSSWDFSNATLTCQVFPCVPLDLCNNTPV